MDEELEVLWLDRQILSVHGSLFDDLMMVQRDAQDLALESPDSRPHAVGSENRIIVDGPSERMIATARYFPSGTVLQGSGAARRLVLGHAFYDEVSPWSEGAGEANALMMWGLSHYLGEEDGRIAIEALETEVISLGEAIDFEAWLVRARISAGLPETTWDGS